MQCAFTVKLVCFDTINVHVLLAAYYQVPPVSQGQQESGQRSKEHGQVFVVPDSRRHPLSTFQLGASQGPGEISWSVTNIILYTKIKGNQIKVFKIY